jgi:MFS family permease
VYVPAAIGTLAARAGIERAAANRLASYGTMLLSVGTILGCLLLPMLAERLGRRRTLGIYFLLMFVFILLAFGYVFYLQTDALFWFMVCLFFLGLGGANFAMYTLWLPEQYPTECRASAFAFATSAGRFVGAGITFLVGAGVSHFGTIGTPVALTSIAFALGILLLPLGHETRGQTLPS